MLPLDFWAALAAWLNRRRIMRLPLGERLLLETSADSSRPGQTPTQEANCSGDGKLAAAGPISAMICCAESGPQPGTAAKRITAC